MPLTWCFTDAERAAVSRTFSHAEKLAAHHFGLGPAGWKSFPYRVKTLASLADHEVRDGVFAYLYRFSPAQREAEAKVPGSHLYRICLQDNRILDALRRGDSFIKFFPLMLYIATHELVHVLRFSRGECAFETPDQERQSEEERVDDITKRILKPVRDPSLKLVIDCFGSDYRLRDSFN